MIVQPATSRRTLEGISWAERGQNAESADHERAHKSDGREDHHRRRGEHSNERLMPADGAVDGVVGERDEG